MIESVRTSTVRHAAARPARSRKVVPGIVVLATVLSACGFFGPDQPDTVAQQFAEALNNDDVQAAADLTTDPDAAAAAITAMYDGLGNTDGTFTRTGAEESDGDGTFTMDVSWPFAPDQQWQYSTSGNATKEGDDWKIVWNPAVLAPGLTDDTTLRYTTTSGTPARVLAASGDPILEQQVVTLVNLEPGADTAAVAALLAPIEPTITAASLQQQLDGADGQAVTAISLRAEDIAPIESQLQQLDSVTLVPQARLITVDKALASPTLSDLGDLWQQGQDESAGWAVQLVAQDGSAETIAGEPGPDAPDIATTLDLPMQMAAERALASVPQQAAIVALRPSTGAVLAVAQNAPADAVGPIALTGLYPPGSTFKTVTTSAALQAGVVAPDTILPCPGTENIDGRQIPNDDEFDLGDVPLHTAFAHSCNTTMGRLAAGLPADALQKAALQFGLGVDYVTPGLTTVTGSVPVADSSAARVESGIGQGQVTASPFGMAMVAASIANGSTPLPMLVQGQPGTADQTPPPVPADVTADLRTMMRETVTDGTATALQDIPGLLGKTGTAESEGGPAHGWFVGIRDDLAFAVFIAGADSSAPAVEAAGRFLR
ncbi:penicillin-binding protein [Rhodococcus sp. WMMA185]|uniref:penicillin-binding transpeptidase domain-containing protein n=1 Tax=Rhodococcus sp. WMMA185 TaxID=679318 RepID=UPI0008789F2E|nr:penicillin-binding transpeptidase domain-containing protein [Rhodococcus sp. WMMA185]AOW91695.1 penicillin-binding protein [Rhodococcus sp. WMMA185]